MSAPIIWIFLPLILSILLLQIRNQRTIALITGIFTLGLTLAAWLLQIDTPMTIGTWSYKVSSSFDFLGRSLILASSDRSFLILIYGSATLWFGITPFIETTRRFIPLGLSMTALLVAALAVEPFLYAALLIEIAVLLSVPMLALPGKMIGKGSIRFLIYQTLAMPFILFSGWLLAGIDANPGDVGLVKQAAILIGLGFSFLLAVFPFYSWIPLITEESSPIVTGFILWIFPTVTLFFGLGFLDHYTWLRDAPGLGSSLTFVGLLMVVSGGVLAAFQQHLGRILGYAVIMETGYSILALTLIRDSGLETFLMLLAPRFLILLIWSFSLTIIRKQIPSLTLKASNGLGRKWPLAASGAVLSNFALAGFPLLAGFPPHLALWSGLAKYSISSVFWAVAGILGFLLCAIRVLVIFVSSPTSVAWEMRETSWQRILLAAGFLALLLFGLFPQWITHFWENFPAILPHLGQ
jgi:NADH:ubiquinone oxidoreductase subunit 2 (subunit N)